VLVIATDAGRAAAWEELLDAVARGGLPVPIVSRLVRFGACGIEVLSNNVACLTHDGMVMRQHRSALRSRSPAHHLRKRRPRSRIPQPVGGPLGAAETVGTGAELTDSEL